MGDLKGLRDELLGIPRMSRSHIYVLDFNNFEVLGRDEALQQLNDRRTVMDIQAHEDSEDRTYTIYTVKRTPPNTILAPGPAGTALRLAAAALISAAISFFLARSLSMPLEQLSVASRRIAAGDFNTRAGHSLLERKDEFGQLATDFDLMVERLQAMQLANQRLLQDVSHELRSPLARLTVALEIARKKGAPTVKSELDRIELESERLGALVNDVLSLMRESSESTSKADEEFELKHPVE